MSEKNLILSNIVSDSFLSQYVKLKVMRCFKNTNWYLQWARTHAFFLLHYLSSCILFSPYNVLQLPIWNSKSTLGILKNWVNSCQEFGREHTHQLESCLGRTLQQSWAKIPLKILNLLGHSVLYALNVQFNISVLSSENKRDERPGFMLKAYSQHNLLLVSAYYASFFSIN